MSTTHHIDLEPRSWPDPYKIHLPCTVDGSGASMLNPGNMSNKEKSSCQTVDIEKKSTQGEGL